MSYGLPLQPSPGLRPFPPGPAGFSPPLQGPTLLLRLRSRSWCVRAGLAPAISRAVASCRNTWAGGARRGSDQAPTPFRHPMSVPTASQGPVGTHPPHGRPDILCQTPQATQVPLETTKLKGRGLGPASRALRGLGGCRQFLPLPEAGACHKEQVTQEQLHGLGVVGKAGQGSGPLAVGEKAGGPRCQGPAPGCTAEALHLPHTCNATAMHRGAARSPGPHAPTGLCGSLQGGPCHMFTPPSSWRGRH